MGRRVGEGLWPRVRNPRDTQTRNGEIIRSGTLLGLHWGSSPSSGPGVGYEEDVDGGTDFLRASHPPYPLRLGLLAPLSSTARFGWTTSRRRPKIPGRAVCTPS